LIHMQSQNFLKHLPIIFSGLLMLFLSGCASSPVNISHEPSQQNLSFLIKKGNEHWDKRNDINDAKKACFYYAQALKGDANNSDLCIKMSRALYFQAMFIEKDPFVKDSLYFQGYQVAIKSLKNRPKFDELFSQAEGDSLQRWLSLISEAPKEWVPALFWWAVNEARYLNTKPVLARLEKRELLEVIMHRIISLEPGYYYGGPYRFFGAFYTRIPGIELSQAQSYFEQAISAFPLYLGSHVYMAEFYHQKAGNREQFHEILDKVISTDLSLLTENIPENIYYQKRAIFLLEQESVLFE